nr:L,D-transpeptidase family protein [Microbacterium immunditiarum]
MWNPTEWFSAPEKAVVQLDPDVATAVLRDAAPSLYTDPVDAQLAFDAASASYVVTPAILGTGIDVDSVRTALQDAFDAGQSRVEFDPVAAPIDAETQTYVADATAYRLNTMLDSMGFYTGGERVVPVDRALAASWITLGDGPRGSFSVEVDQQAIEAFVETIPALVHREPVNATVVTNSSGTVLRTLSEGVEGRTLESTDGIAAAFAEQLQNVNGVYELPMTTLPFTTTALARTIEVNLSSQRAYLYENGNLVSSHVISSGLPGSATPAGHFTVNGYSRVQSMGCFEGAPYCVRDVPWVTWFAPDIGFHGANSLRSSLGFPQSHGCVNMWDAEARFVYEWSAYGTEVWVHY